LEADPEEKNEEQEVNEGERNLVYRLITDERGHLFSQF
jgi:hypothetical protein